MELISDAPRNEIRGKRVALLAATLGAAAFFIVAQLVVAFYRSEAIEIPVLSQKLAALEEMLPQIDLVIIGSSHVYRNIDPLEFDPAMAALGCDIRSYNMGVAGMNVNEANYIVSRLGGENAPAWLLLENLPPVRPSSFGNERSRMFMRLQTLPLAMRDILSASVGEARRWRMLGLVLYAHLYEEAGTGMLASKLIGAAHTAGDERDYWGWGESRRRRGYLALEDETAGQFVARHERHLANREKFQQELQQYVRAVGNAEPSTAQGRLRYLNSVLDNVTVTIPNVVLVLMPNPEKGGHSRALELAASGSAFDHPLVNLNDPDRYQWLLDRDMWFDSKHLARAGSLLLSQALAREICPLMRAD